MILLLNYQTSLERHPRIQAANSQEVAEYKDIVEKTAIIQSQAGTDIVTLKEDLVKAQKSRDQKLEYDRVAREIMKFETRNTYAESISNLQDDIALLEREKANKLQAFDDRKHNLTTLLESLKNLQKSVEDERADMVSVGCTDLPWLLLTMLYDRLRIKRSWQTWKEDTFLQTTREVSICLIMRRKQRRRKRKQLRRQTTDSKRETTKRMKRKAFCSIHPW